MADLAIFTLFLFTRAASLNLLVCLFFFCYMLMGGKEQPSFGVASHVLDLISSMLIFSIVYFRTGHSLYIFQLAYKVLHGFP